MGEPVTLERNVAVKRAIRNDLRYIVPQVPNRYFYKRGPWYPVAYKAVPHDSYVDGDKFAEGEVTPGAGYALPPSLVPPGVNETAVINIATAATHEIIPASPGRSIHIHFVTWTVGGDVNVTLYDGANAFTGAMDFGGVNEPRGIVLPQDGKAIELGVNNAFSMLLSAAVQVSGFVIYSYV